MPVNDAGELREILKNSKVIAVVGYSHLPSKISHQIGQMLERVGYTVYPVNPECETIDGKKSYPSLADVPEPIDIVNVFRRPQFLKGVVEDAISVGAKAVWAQVGITDNEAARLAEEAGLKMVMDRCIKVDYYRLMD